MPRVWEGEKREQGGKKEESRPLTVSFSSRACYKPAGSRHREAFRASAGRGTRKWHRKNIMVEKQSARRTLCFRARTAREARANRLLFGRERGSASRRCLIPAGRTDGLWLAVAPFTSGAGSADMTGMASGWQRRLPRPPAPGQAVMGDLLSLGADGCPSGWVPSLQHTPPTPSQAPVGTRRGRGPTAGALILAARHRLPSPGALNQSVRDWPSPWYPLSAQFPHRPLPHLPAALCSRVGLSDVSSPREALPSRARGPLHAPCVALRLAQSGRP